MHCRLGASVARRPVADAVCRNAQLMRTRPPWAREKLHQDATATGVGHASTPVQLPRRALRQQPHAVLHDVAGLGPCGGCPAAGCLQAHQSAGTASRARPRCAAGRPGAARAPALTRRPADARELAGAAIRRTRSGLPCQQGCARAWQPGVTRAPGPACRSSELEKSLSTLARLRCSWMRRARRATRASARPPPASCCTARSSSACRAAGVAACRCM